MAVRLAESLLDCGGFDPADILERYLRWWKEGAFDTGPVSARVLTLVAGGMPAFEASAQYASSGWRGFSGSQQNTSLIAG